MKAMRVIKIAMNLVTFICCVTFGCFAAPAEGEEPVERAVVKNDVLSVHAAMSEKSAVVKQLKKNDAVTVELEISGEGGEWCGIKDASQAALIGFVPCPSLERKAARKTEWKNVGTKVITDQEPPRKENAVSSPVKKLRPYSDVTAILYMTSW